MVRERRAYIKTYRCVTLCQGLVKTFEIHRAFLEVRRISLIFPLFHTRAFLEVRRSTVHIQGHAPPQYLPCSTPAGEAQHGAHPGARALLPRADAPQATDLPGTEARARGDQEGAHARASPQLGRGGRRRRHCGPGRRRAAACLLEPAPRFSRREHQRRRGREALVLAAAGRTHALHGRPLEAGVC